jgi:hypothetical protein
MFMMAGMMAAMPVRAQDASGSTELQTSSIDSNNVGNVVLETAPTAVGGGGCTVLVYWHVTIYMLVETVDGLYAKLGKSAIVAPGQISIGDLHYISNSIQSDRDYAVYLEYISVDETGNWKLKSMDEATQMKFASALYMQDPNTMVNIDTVEVDGRSMYSATNIPLPPETGAYVWNYKIMDHPDEGISGALGNGYYQVVYYAMAVTGNIYGDVTASASEINGLRADYNYFNKGAVAGSTGAEAALTPPQGGARATSTLLGIFASTGGASYGGGIISPRGSYQGYAALPVTPYNVPLAMDFSLSLETVRG